MEHEKTPSEYKQDRMSELEKSVCKLEQYISDAKAILEKRIAELIASGDELIEHTWVKPCEIIDQKMAEIAVKVNNIDMPTKQTIIWTDAKRIFADAQVPLPMKTRKGFLRLNSIKKLEEE